MADGNSTPENLPIEWNPVNTVTNSPKKFGRINGVAVLTRGYFLKENVRRFLPGRKARFHCTWQIYMFYNQLQKYLRHCTVFWHKCLSMILCLWCPLHPLSKLLAIQDHTQNLEEQLWMGGRREVSILSHRPVTWSNLKQERSFFRGSVSTFLQLVVAMFAMKFETNRIHFNLSAVAAIIA